MEFPDAESVVMDLLEQVAFTCTMASPETPMPHIRVSRVGGTDDDVTDFPEVEVECFAQSAAQAKAMARQCRRLIETAAASKVNGILVDDTGCLVGPMQIPDIDPDDRRLIATYQLLMRRQ
ncbi:uncharacterized protein DUF3168 [Rhodococcus sp. OK519]|uniref:phage tail termination protein n=1 Tax=Rhodococcus sp. OK519 TaxID=2135729 RepID=UPI000D3AE217|nr:uncharacterized protein DUF3168 [Rhodococcus sp. OK519]